MPNYCDYELKVSGKTKESILDFVKSCKSEYDYSTMELPERHFSRVFEAECAEDGIQECEGVYSLVVSGYCAWSFVCCFGRGGYTYFDSFKKTLKGKSRATCIQKECKRLNIFVEAYSEELGCMFQEHVIYSPRGIVVAESKNIEGMYNDDGELVNPEVGYEWAYRDFSLNDFAEYSTIAKYKSKSKARKRHKRKLKKHKR